MLTHEQNYALEYAIKYMGERVAFGKSLDQFQALRHNIAEMASRVDMCKEYNYSISKTVRRWSFMW